MSIFDYIKNENLNESVHSIIVDVLDMITTDINSADSLFLTCLRSNIRYNSNYVINSCYAKSILSYLTQHVNMDLSNERIYHHNGHFYTGDNIRKQYMSVKTVIELLLNIIIEDGNCIGFTEGVLHYVKTYTPVSSVCQISNMDVVKICNDAMNSTIYVQRDGDTYNVLMTNDNKQLSVDDMIKYITDEEYTCVVY